MRHNNKQEWEDVTLKSLKSELRSLPELQVPDKLKQKLLVTIPNTSGKPARTRRIRWYPRVSDLGVTAAAAALIFAFMFMVDNGLSVPSQMSMTEFNDALLGYARWDQNNPLYDHNYAVVEGTNYTNKDNQQ